MAVYQNFMCYFMTHEHSLQDSPSNLSYGSTTDMAKQIADSTECAAIVNLFKSDVAGTSYVRKTNCASAHVR